MLEKVCYRFQVLKYIWCTGNVISGSLEIACVVPNLTKLESKNALVIRRQIDIVTYMYQVRKAYTSLCLFVDELYIIG